ncbi:hypothetical protein [Zeaxanthinibacter enoshimensis]|uniref:hypothetical protein n=1 Tax=Zeaxanthinibacter enoshimensis TaxID=392009 RepID=UPI0035692EA1
MKKSLLIFAGILIISFSCWAFVIRDMDSLKERISFHEVPMVCNAAPDIGCGSLAKPVLLELSEEPSIKEAWLNRQGTVTAIEWEKGMEHDTKIISRIFAKHGFRYKTLEGTAYKRELKSFGSDRWYKSDAVHELSMEEAERIAYRIIDPLVTDGILLAEDAESLHSDVKQYIQNKFLTLEDVGLLSTTEYYDEWEVAIKEMGEKYTTQMPDIEMCSPASYSCKKSSSSCCSKDEKVSCSQ